VRLFCATVLLLAVRAWAAGDSDVDGALEQRVKAAYLYRFTEFVIWPPEAFANEDTPLVIAIAGSSAFARELGDIVAGRSGAGRRIEVRSIPDPAASLGSAHILFIPASERVRLAQFIRVAGARTLIVTETEGALALGSVINFVIVDGRVRFEVSLKAAETRGLRLSARMLAVAHSVLGGP
jgi:hypothetical protein